MDHKFEGARGKHRNQDMRPEFSASHTGSMTSDRVCGLLFEVRGGEKPEVKLTGLGLELEYCQPKPVFLGQISISSL